MANSSNCPICNSKLTLLFYSSVCDTCNPPSTGPAFSAKTGEWHYAIVGACDSFEREDLFGKWTAKAFKTVAEGVKHYDTTGVVFWKVKSKMPFDYIGRTRYRFFESEPKTPPKDENWILIVDRVKE